MPLVGRPIVPHANWPVSLSPRASDAVSPADSVGLGQTRCTAPKYSNGHASGRTTGDLCGLPTPAGLGMSCGSRAGAGIWGSRGRGFKSRRPDAGHRVDPDSWLEPGDHTDVYFAFLAHLDRWSRIHSGCVPARGHQVCDKFLYQGFKAAPRGRSRRRHGRHSRAPANAPARPRLNAGRLARRLPPFGAAAGTARRSPGRGGFDKGTLAAALIGHLRAGQKPARSANQRTGRRPLSNPPLRLRDTERLGRCPCSSKNQPNVLHLGIVSHTDR
jgi:hypothetical protein